MPQKSAEEKTKLGRNDPCGCGSGKKYKHCCLDNTVSADLLWSQVNAASLDLTSTLLEFAVERFAADIEDAWDDFHFGEPDAEYRAGDDVDSIFMPYFLYRWQDLTESDDLDGSCLPGTIATLFLLENGRSLSQIQMQLLLLCMKQPITFYEILENHPGQSMFLREIFTGQEYDVRERSASRFVQTGDILFAQMSPLEGLTTMAFCAPMPIPPSMKSLIVSQRMMLQSIGKKKNRRIFSTADLLDFEEDFRELYLEIGDRLNLPPVLTNTDGDPLEMHTMNFELRLSPADAFDMLAPLLAGIREKEDILAEGEFDATGELRALDFCWYKKGNKKMKSWDNTVLGHLRLSPGLLVADVNSRKRAEKLRREIEDRLRLGVVHKETLVQTSADLLEKIKHMPPQPRQQSAAKQAELMKDPAVLAGFRDSMQKEADAWIHKKVPALGGRTPLQAVKNPDMKEIVESLLIDFERHAASSYPPEASPDFSGIRNRLGIPLRQPRENIRPAGRRR